MSGADHRIVAAVEMLRSLQADGFSVPLLVELALGKKGLRYGRPVEERAIILALYREELERPGSITYPQPAFERAPVDPKAPVFANFVARWPDVISDECRDVVAFEWRKLSAAEQPAAISGIEDWIALCRLGGRDNAGPATLYLRHRSWKRTPAVLPAMPLIERTSA